MGPLGCPEHPIWRPRRRLGRLQDEIETAKTGRTSMRHLPFSAWFGPYVCMYVRVPVCLYACMSVCMHIHTYIRMYVCTYVRMYAHTYIHTYVHTYVCMYVCTYVCLYVCMSVHTYVCMPVCLYVSNVLRSPIVFVLGLWVFPLAPYGA